MKIKLLLVSILFSCFSWGQILIPSTTPVTQNFDLIGNAGTATLPTGFKVSTSANYTTGTTVTTLVAGTTGAGALTGTSGGGVYNYANGITATSTDRAVGFLTSSGFASPRTIMLAIQNTNASTMTDLSITFDYEKYRTGTRAFDWTFFHGATATLINTSTVTGNQSYGVDGANAVVNPPTSISKTVTLTGLSIPTNGLYYFCWTYTGLAGSTNSQGLGLDNLSITAAFGAATPNLAITGTPTNHGSVCTTASGASIQYTITNSGSVAASGVTVGSSDPQFAVSGLSSTTIATSGGTATYNITFTPTSAGTQNATITVSSSTVGSNSPNNALLGTGITPVTPTITTNVSTNVLSSTATINGTNVLGVCPSTTVRGFVYAPTATNSNPQVGGSGVIVNNSSIGAGNFLANLSTLAPTTQYSFVAYVFDGTTYTYGAVLTFTTTILTSNSSDIVSVASSESPTISSLINDVAPLTTSTGVQVWQFKVRDGGATLNDADTFPTILTDFTIAQAGGNTVSNWIDGINTIALFDGSIFIASGTVTATSIVFSSLNFSVDDNTEKTLSLRLSLKCPLGANAFDGEDFGFSVSNANVTFSNTGSTKAAFSAQTSSNLGVNIISVVATKLTFTSQPTSTGINAAMTNVVITATDVCNNKDLGFTGTVVLTSTGTMTGSPINLAAVAGVATYSNLIHTAIGTNLILSATATGLTGATSSLFDILAVTELTRGDLAILAVNINTTNGGSGSDEIVFVCFQDILIGTTFYITDNGYERQFAGKWGSSEGIVSITRSGTTLPKGTVIVFRANTPNVLNSTHFDIYTCGLIDSNWSKGIVNVVGDTGSGGFNLNGNDDIWITQGGVWTDDTTTNHNVTYNGTVLYGWTESGWDAAPGGASQSTAWSTLFPSADCYVTVAPTGDGFVKFNEPAPNFASTSLSKLDWILRINTTSNWSTYADNATYVAGGFNYFASTLCPLLNIVPDTFVNGKWTGVKSTNWFDCANWDTLVVPDETVDVQVGDNTFNNQATISATAPFANDYGNIAKARNLIITGEKVELVGNIANKLEINGNLIIDAPAGVLDMDDNTIANDGELKITGNWINNIGNTAFEEGNGTVIFNGTTPQIINNISPEGTEVFFNVTLNNNFDTSVSNNLIATGSLQLDATKTLTIPANNYVSINKVLTNSGIINIANSGSLIQTENGFLNLGSGTTNVTRITPAFDKFDYTYWSSPIKDDNLGTRFAAWNLNQTYNFVTENYSDQFNDASYPQTTGIPDAFDDTNDDWVNIASPTSTTMTAGVGYAVMGGTSGSFPRAETVTFSGNANNGIIPFALKQSANLVETADDYNLVGNPYPSSIKADDFIKANILPLGSGNNISGTLYFWTHGGNLQPALTNPGPNVNNYNANEYALYNLTGSIGTAAGNPGNPISDAPNGFIGTGQAFFVEAENTSDLVFNNSMRNKLHTNIQFFRGVNADETKDRLWLNFQNIDNMFSQQLIGYLPDTSLDFDYGYDGRDNKTQNYVSFYSFINAANNDLYKIQSRSDFNANDFVKLGFFSAVSGQSSISIDRFEGVFANQNIYLQDNLLNITHDLKQAPYSFTTNYGTFNDRFILKYNNTVLGNSVFESDEKNLKIFVKDNKINLISDKNIKTIEVFDLLGRRIFDNQTINSKTFSVENLNIKNQTLIVKTKLENGQIFTKKVIL